MYSQKYQIETIRKSVLPLTLIHTMSISLTLTQIYSIPFYYILSNLQLIIFITAFHQARIQKSIIAFLFVLIQTIIVSIYIVIIFFNIQYMPLHFFSIYFLIISLTKLVELYKSYKSVQTIDDQIASMILQIMLLVQAILFNFKCTTIIQWAWVHTFIMLEITLTILCLINLILILDCFAKLFQQIKLKNQVKIQESIFGCWASFSFLAFSIFPLFSLICFLSYLDNDTIYYQIEWLFKSSISYVSLYYFVTMVYLMKMKNQLPENIDNVEEPASEEPIKVNQFIMPQYLVKVSASYFKPQAIYRQDDMVHSGLYSSSTTNRKFLTKNEMNFEQNMRMKSEEANIKSMDQIQVNEEQVGQLKQIKELEMKCTVCFDNDWNIVFLPCGHGGVCQKCCVDLLKVNKSCYLCRIHQEGGETLKVKKIFVF